MRDEPIGIVQSCSITPGAFYILAGYKLLSHQAGLDLRSQGMLRTISTYKYRLNRGERRYTETHRTNRKWEPQEEQRLKSAVFLNEPNDTLYSKPPAINSPLMIYHCSKWASGDDNSIFLDIRYNGPKALGIKNQSIRVRVCKGNWLYLTCIFLKDICTLIYLSSYLWINKF